MRSRWSCGSSTSITSARMSALLGATGDQAKASAPAGHGDRDGARQERARRGVAPRPEQGLPQDVERRAAGADAAVHVEPLLHRHRLAADLRAERRRARVLQGVRPARWRRRRSIEIKAYLRWQVAHASAAVLSKPFVDENFRFYGTALTGAKELRPRWKRCVQYTDDDLGEVAGTGVRQGGVRTAGEGRHAQDGARARGGARRPTSTASAG